MRFSILSLIVARAGATIDATPRTPDAPSLPASDGDVRMHRAQVDVSFRAGSAPTGALDMVVIHDGDTVECPNLREDVHDVTEVRSSDGVSFDTLRGSGGYLLQSSQSGIECRVHLRSASGEPYTVADVPHAPGLFSAAIVFPSGHYLDITYDNATHTYVSFAPEQRPGGRRRLETYGDFPCKLPAMRSLKMGIVVDEKYLTDIGQGNRNFITQQVQGLWKQASVPYETQINIKVLPWKIIFHDDPLLKGEKWLECDVLPVTKTFGLAKWRNTKVKDALAGWYLVTPCTGNVLGYAIPASMALRYTSEVHIFTAAVGMGKPDFYTVTHEIGHMWGAKHRPGRDIMDAGSHTTSMRFDQSHAVKMCPVVERAASRDEPSNLVKFNERWASSSSQPTPPTSSTRPPSSPTSTRPPVSPTSTRPPVSPTSTRPPPSSKPSSPTSSTSSPPTSSAPSPPTSSTHGDANKDTNSISSTTIIITVSCAIAALLLLVLFLYCFFPMSKADEQPAGTTLQFTRSEGLQRMVEDKKGKAHKKHRKNDAHAKTRKAAKTARLTSPPAPARPLSGANRE
eukprot:GEMP01029424.1.p1 GENE.GEMP01029424.1~~GEMP01029424.1.p1  ORF type:complete len:568 (-),score=111.56 GEMP01029424.1:377-2080(-)